VCTSSHTNNNFIRNMDILSFSFWLTLFLFFTSPNGWRIRCAHSAGVSNTGALHFVFHTAGGIYSECGVWLYPPQKKSPDLLDDLNRSISRSLWKSLLFLFYFKWWFDRLRNETLLFSFDICTVHVRKNLRHRDLVWQPIDFFPWAGSGFVD
jgi:hypothetical protein